MSAARPIDNGSPRAILHCDRCAYVTPVILVRGEIPPGREVCIRCGQIASSLTLSTGR